MTTSALGVYLTDHLGGAIAGTDLAESLRERLAGTPHGPFFAELAAAITEDRATLEALMADLRVEKSRLKDSAGRVVERLGRLTLHERLTGSAELTTMLEAEALSLGIEGKLALWKSLRTVAGHHPALAATDLEGLARRAREQLDGLEPHRLELAAAALAG